MSELELKTLRLDFSSYAPGCTNNPANAVFRLYSPHAKNVVLEIWNQYSDEKGKQYGMFPSDDGYWNVRVVGDQSGKWYAYHVYPDPSRNGLMEPYWGPISDPWSTHVTSRNTYLQEAKSYIEPPDEYDWEEDQWMAVEDPRDLIIYEAHLKDFTAGNDLQDQSKGAYKLFVDDYKWSGVRYLKKIGVNAVEFLPLQKAARHEPPYLMATQNGILNTWNYYGYNHWGYMTSHFFAPETLFASEQSNESGAIVGKDLRARNEFRDVVKTLHREGMAVILDVVYNHVSHYDLNPLRHAAKSDYFRLDESHHYLSNSGCGNDAKTEHPEFRKLIVSSILYWMKTYHIDGFRFDLAHLIDWETIDEITYEARKLNPHVVLIAEPWGGGYDPTGFSKRGWLAWNDQIRNSIKGSDPLHHKGFIFGEWHHEASRQAIENYLRGTLLDQQNGRFTSSRTCLNYLESHDGYTLGDFIRIALNPDWLHQRLDREKIVALGAQGEKIARLAALFLMVSQGTVMLHQGQEFARTKWIIPHEVNDPNTGTLDYNSYEKDNGTNYIHYKDIKSNPVLFDYYKGLIQLRKNAPALKKSDPQSIHFHHSNDPLLVLMHINGRSSGDIYDYFVVINANHHQEHEVYLPDGYWELIATPELATNKTLAKLSGRVIIPVCSGSVYRQLFS